MLSVVARKLSRAAMLVAMGAATIRRRREASRLFAKYRSYTMVPPSFFAANLDIAARCRDIEGSVVECGVWRGGMIAAIAELLGSSRTYFLYDSFEGLPVAKEVDGKAAIQWQQNIEGATFFDNCKAEESYARTAVSMAGAHKIIITKGWFENTVPLAQIAERISLLRLDGDWYDSTIVCLRSFAPKMAPGGIIIIDDYHIWDGCSRAVHDYLSEVKSAWRISEWRGVCFIHVPL